MLFPRNAYTRHAARQAGRAFQRWREHANVVEGKTRSVRGHYLCGTIDPDFWLERAERYHREADRWRSACWCSVRVGEFAEAGHTTLGAFLHAIGAYAPELILIPVGVSLVAGLIWFGAFLGGR